MAKMAMRVKIKAIAAFVFGGGISILSPLVHAQDCFLPGAPNLTRLQWNLCNYGQPFRIRSEKIGRPGVVGADIQIREAWSIVESSPHVIVAVIDSGFDLNHAELANVFLQGQQKSFLHPSKKIQSPDSVLGVHGNLVSGIIGASGRDLNGITGVAREVRILPIQAVPQGDSNENDHLIAQALRYAVNSGADIINCSFGKYSTSPVVEEAVRYANDHNVLIVASVGNNQKDVSAELHWPSSYSTHYGNVIGVAATDRTDQLWINSNYGLTVDLAAPGDEILSTGWYNQDPFNHYFTVSGTSMAAAHVSAVAALVLQLDDSLKPAEIKSILVESADRIPSLIGKTKSGRLNAFAALKKAKSLLELSSEQDSCGFSPEKTIQQEGSLGHSAFWTIPSSSVFDPYESTSVKATSYRDWVTRHTSLSAWENLLLGLSIVTEAKAKFSRAEPIYGYLERLSYNYRAIHGGVGRIRKMTCLETVLFEELLNVTDMTLAPIEFSAKVFRKDGRLKALGTFLVNSSSGSSDSVAVAIESARLEKSGWKLAAHIHNPSSP